jgi:hypothetical protein
MSDDTLTVEEWISANSVPCEADGVEHDCGYEFLRVEVGVARWFLAEVERAAAEKAWDEGERHESEFLARTGQFCPYKGCNPYRKGQSGE